MDAENIQTDYFSGSEDEPESASEDDDRQVFVIHDPESALARVTTNEDSVTDTHSARAHTKNRTKSAHARHAVDPFFLVSRCLPGYRSSAEIPASLSPGRAYRRLVHVLYVHLVLFPRLSESLLWLASHSCVPDDAAVLASAAAAKGARPALRAPATVEEHRAAREARRFCDVTVLFPLLSY